MTDVLLVGGTGDLGGRIAARLTSAGCAVRALVRPRSDASSLRALGVEVVAGDLTDPAGLREATSGVSTVVTTANAIGRVLGGERDLSIDAVDREGNAALIRAAEAAGVQRFVFVSVVGPSDAMVAASPFAAAKRATDRLLQASPMRTVIVRPGPFQGLWLGPDTGIHPDRRLAVIFGQGRSRASYVAEDDVAEACARLATMPEPPAEVHCGGPEALTRRDVVAAFERAYGARFRRVFVPRPVLAVGARASRRRPAMTSVLGLPLVMDLEGCTVPPDDLRALGIEPRSTTDAIAAMAGARVGSAT